MESGSPKIQTASLQEWKRNRKRNGNVANFNIYDMNTLVFPAYLLVVSPNIHFHVEWYIAYECKEQ